MRQAEKEKKKFYFRIPFKLDSGKKIPKKIAKKLKNPFPTLFLAKAGCDRPRNRGKNFSPKFRSHSTRASKFRKKCQKNLKKLKKLFPALFLAKAG